MPWPLPDGDADRLALAKGYPFPAPALSYLFAEGDHRLLDPGEELDPALFAGRTPVLAHGSNRSPEQLARKYGSDATIPVSRGWLAGYDVVYSAHISQYGSIASTLQYAPGAAALVSVTWLDRRQLARMHETEGPTNYQFGELAGIALTLEVGPAPVLEGAAVYLSTNGCLARGREPVGLAAVTARDRPHAALWQEAALGHVRSRHRADEELERMILRSVADSGYRRALVEEMRAEAVPARAPHFAPDTR